MLLVSPYTRALGPRSESSQAVLSRSLAAPPVQLPVRSLPAQSPPRPSHGVSHLSATFSSGSDLHRVYLPRLCCALRFSQPLDAFFRPNLPDLVSCQCHPGFQLQRIPLRDSLECLATPSAPLTVLRQVSQPAVPAPGIHALAKSVSSRPVLPGCERPSLSCCSPLRGLPLSISAPLRVPPLMGFNTPLVMDRSPGHRRVCSAEFQRAEK